MTDLDEELDPLWMELLEIAGRAPVNTAYLGSSTSKLTRWRNQLAHQIGFYLRELKAIDVELLDRNTEGKS